MMIRRAGKHVVVCSLLTVLWVSPLGAQSNRDSAAKFDAASHVSAELVKGTLNPEKSKAGDEVSARLTEDFKANGEVVLKKGSTITGVVKSVKRLEGKSEGRGSAQSMMEVQWLAPAVSGAASQQLNLALQSIAYTNPLYAHRVREESAGAADSGFGAGPAVASQGRGAAGGGLLGGAVGVVGGVTSSAGVVGGAGANLAGDVGGQAIATVSGHGAAAVPVQPAPLPAGSPVVTALRNDFAVSGDRFFIVGHGQAISSGGTASSMDLYSRMSNDTIITSSSRDFELSSGAQLQFLVGAEGTR